MFGMSSADALVFDMEASPRQHSKERAEARVSDIRAAIRRVRNRAERSVPGEHDEGNRVEAYEFDQIQPEEQEATPQQQQMHDTYANERAAVEDMLRGRYPNFTVPMPPIAHKNR